jgi:anti-sigma factor RsiW
MNCQETKTNFDERLDGRLDAARNAAFDAHVNHCPDCAAQWRAFDGAWNALAQQTVSVPSTGFADRMLRQLDETAADRPVLWLAPLWRWPVAVGSAGNGHRTKPARRTPKSKCTRWRNRTGLKIST